jgi:cytochrome c5
MAHRMIPGLLVALFLTGCGAPYGHDHHHHVHGGIESEPSGATCPPGSPLTYETFGQPFMQRYCTGCHASSVAPAQRQGAPTNRNLDTLDGIRAVGLEHLDAIAAAGPNGINQVMPPYAHHAQPTYDERRQLGEWLACELP